MIVLGLHGWRGTHDAAAALVVDGQLVACIEEERLTRQKHAVDAAPVLAARAVLADAGLRVDDVDVVAYGWDLPAYTAAHGLGGVRDAEVLAAVLGGKGPKTVTWVQHHVAHAACALATSGFAAAAVLVVDGQGEDKSISLFSASEGRLCFVQDWLPSRSLGLLYEAATLHCGFGFLDAGKTMGLAAHADASDDRLQFTWCDGDFETPLPEDAEEDDVTSGWRAILEERFGSPARPRRVYDRSRSALVWERDDVAAHHPHVAALAQATVEDAVRALVRYAQAATGHRKVVLAGGVALNCVANGLVLNDCEDLFVPPTAHDAGAALGAAMWVALEANEDVTPPTGASYGPGFTNDEIRQALDRSKVSYREVEDPAVEGSLRLLGGEVIGWFQGRMEIGPRALGRRSILAVPDSPHVKDLVNTIKGRELWRPLAPSILEEESVRFFGRELDSPYMLISLPLTEFGLNEAPAVAHVDGSARMQTVRRSSDDPFARLIGEVGAESGMNVVLNTSFNAPGEPVVCTPGDALRTFSTMGLDALLIGDFVVAKA